MVVDNNAAEYVDWAGPSGVLHTVDLTCRVFSDQLLLENGAS
jgi:hypothetical protein